MLSDSAEPELLNELKEIARSGALVISVHAEKRRRLRGVSRKALEQTLEEFKVIESYPAAYPLPALLLLGAEKNRPIHLAVGVDRTKRVSYIITVYFPDEEHFESDQITRKKK